MSRYLPVCDGVLSLSPLAKQYIQCTGGAGWISVDATYLPGQFNLSMVDPFVCSQAFGAGFSCVGVVLLAAKGVQLVLRAIRGF